MLIDSTVRLHSSSAGFILVSLFDSVRRQPVLRGQVFSGAFLTRSDIRAGPLASVLNRPLPSSAPADFDLTTCVRRMRDMSDEACPNLSPSM